MCCEGEVPELSTAVTRMVAQARRRLSRTEDLGADAWASPMAGSAAINASSIAWTAALASTPRRARCAPTAARSPIERVVAKVRYPTSTDLRDII